MVSYGMNPVDLFEANDLFESGNLTQVQVSLLALAGKVRPEGSSHRGRERPWGLPSQASTKASRSWQTRGQVSETAASACPG